MVKRLLAAGLLALSGTGPSVAAALFPGGFSAEYALQTGHLTVARSEVSLTPGADGRFVYELRVGLTGIVSLFRDVRTLERSEGRYRETDGLRPVAYRYERRGEQPKSAAIAFDWDARVAHNTVRGRTQTVALPDGTLDKLSYMLVLMQDLELGKRDIRYRVAEGGDVTTYHLKAVGRERLDTALGRLDTVKVQRLREGKAHDITFWCALALRFLPVKVVHRQNDGRVVSVFIRSVHGLAPGEPRGTSREHGRGLR
ncbi:MAG: DUF3108 domain-containing protein [Gammaproteobacteria bacterium]|nr:DUF3108 domain-containing protein [Gammaproteobacteria bacterium]NIR85097.1 DUF3108 domain-containing protein [Gammaproteobacteria bacterium]NIR92007.1 DUF3108 domain-containing protein [Gammaproteobacteria bacterium]NIU06146.1 DUF3108 domain-containing protein [Gammaproteobacteria bacterium]NIV53089.1 DUF3108 domain-containing protein [Gammaproteobacteria bacterium]